MRNCSLFILFFCSAGAAFAETDTLYIQPYAQKMDISVFAGRDFINVNEQDVDYKPNNPVKLGAGVSIKNSIFDLSYSFNIGSRANDELPKTKSFDLQLHHYGKKYMLDLYLQNYKGFYSDLFEVKSYPEMQVLQVGAEGAYIFNNKRFSARAAFTQSERQLRSAGSFIIGGGSYFFRRKRAAEELNYLQFGGNFGYAYSWVVTRNVFVSGAATGGAYVSNQINPSKVSASFNMLARLAAGYNTDNWCVYVPLMYHMHFFRNHLTFNSGSFQLVFVRRFDKIPFIDKFKK